MLRVTRKQKPRCNVRAIGCIPRRQSNRSQKIDEDNPEETSSYKHQAAVNMKDCAK